MTRTLNPKDATVTVSARVGNNAAYKSNACHHDFSVTDVGKLFEKRENKILGILFGEPCGIKIGRVGQKASFGEVGCKYLGMGAELAHTVGKLFASTRNRGYNDKNILIHGRSRFYTSPRYPVGTKYLEPVWHRATLDLMAALSLTGADRFVGTVVSYRAGHTLDCDAVRALYRNDLLTRL